MHFQGGAILSDRNGYVFKSNSIANKIINPLGFKTDFSKFEGSAEMADNIENAALHNETTQFNCNCTIEGIEHTLEINISPLGTDNLVLILIKFQNKEAQDLEIFKQAFNKIPADIAIFNEDLKYEFLNKSAVKDDKLREWLMGKDDFDYCSFRNLSPSIAEERVRNLKKLGESDYIEFVETFAGPSSPVNTWSNRRIFSFRTQTNERFILGYGVRMEVSKGDENKFLDILNSLNESVLEIDFNGKFLLHNSAWKNLIGLPEGLESDSYLIDFIHEEDKLKVKSELNSIFLNNLSETAANPVRIKTINGYLWIELKFTRNTESDGKFKIYCIIKDIDEARKSTEIINQLKIAVENTVDDARKSTEIINQLKIAVENTVDGIAVMNGEDQYTYLNKSHIELFGYTDEEEILGKSWKIFYPPQEIERIEKEVFPVFMEKGFFRGPTLGVKKDGTYMFQEISLTALPNGGLIFVTHNVTEELERQKELQQLAIVAEKTSSIVIICSAEGRIEWVNKSFEELTEYSLEEVKGLFPLEFMAGEETDPKVIAQIQDCVQKGKSFKGEILNYSKTGERFWLYLDITTLYDESNMIQGFIAVENNITAVKEAEEKLLFALNKEKQLNHLKSHFVNLVSHEFRTPLATIQSSMDVLQGYTLISGKADIAKLIETIIKHQNRIENEIQRMTQIMDNVLLLGRMEANKMVFRPEYISINKKLNLIISELNASKRGITSINFNSFGKENLIFADPFLLSQAFENIINNSVKYSSPNSPITISVFHESDKIIVEVADEGIGIPENELSNIFDSFFRASNADDIQGTGLGLVIVKQLIELHHGSVALRNNKNKGVTFNVTLPVNESLKST